MEGIHKNSLTALILRNDKSNMFINTHLLRPSQEDKRVRIMQRLLNNSNSKLKIRRAGGSLEHSTDKLSIPDKKVETHKNELNKISHNEMPGHVLRGSKVDLHPDRAIKIIQSNARSPV